MKDPFNSQERTSVWQLSTLMCIRMLGLFMILPVIRYYAESLSGQGPLLIGLTIGIYGLSQACLQIPFGYWSDRLGRKPIIVLGLCFLGLGSLIAALSTHVLGLLIGRALQGFSAIGSVIMAFAADLTRPQQRTKTMAILGGLIGLSFALSLILGSALYSWLGARAIFFTNALLAACGLFLLLQIKPVEQQVSSPEKPLKLLENRRALLTPDLIRLYLGVFCLHAMLSSLFFELPHLISPILTNSFSMSNFYLTTVISGFALTALFFIADKRTTQPLQRFAIILLVLAQGILALLPISLAHAILAMILFFGAFAYLEAAQPALISRLIVPQLKGSALGIYATAQFLGIFAGGSLTGLLARSYTDQKLLLFNLLLGLSWLLFHWRLKSPQAQNSCPKATQQVL